MIRQNLERYAKNELKYQVKRGVSSQIRKQCPKGDPMVTGITVVMGTFLLMTIFNSILDQHGLVNTMVDTDKVR
jgi:hypothetical protein